MLISATYRPFRAGSIAAPLHARSVGHYRFDGAHEESRAGRPFVQLYWGVAGEAEFRHGDELWCLGPGQVCCYLPDDEHRIGIAAAAEYYWLTFDGEHAAFILDAFGLERAARPAGPCPVELFLQLDRELRDYSGGGQLLAGVTCYAIVSRAAGAARPDHPELVEEFKRLVAENYGDCGFNIAAAARLLGLHRSTLCRLFAAAAGMSPAEYLGNSRIQAAMRRILDTRDSMKEIAEETGFRDQNYFSKAITRRFGHPPSVLRRKAL